ncbi:MAG: actin, cytoplasmic 2 [Candidatus Hodarchaeota archaeon]
MDIGSHSIRLGFAGENRPQLVFPTLIGYPKYSSLLPDLETIIDNQIHEYYIGEETRPLRGILRLINPVECRLIVDWDAMEKIWHHIFYYILRIEPSVHPVLLTESPLNPARNREKMAEILFERFHVPAICISTSAALSLYASGRTTGLVIDIGKNILHIVPIKKGVPITQAIKRLEIGGQDITKYLYRLLLERSIQAFGYTFSHPLNGVSYELAQDVKERCCYVALDPEKELRLAETDSRIERQIYLRLMESNLTISLERFLAPEVFFQQEVMDRSTQPLHKAVNESIQKCDIALQSALYRNIVLSGGSSQFPGLGERLHNELTKLVPKTIGIRIIAPPERKLTAWIGGAMLASHKTFPNICLRDKEYREQGSEIINSYSTRLPNV